MAKKLDLYHQLLDLAYSLGQSVSKYKVQTDDYQEGMYNNQSTDVEDYILKDAIAIIDVNLFEGLPAHACKYLLGIIKGMKRNNVFYRVKDTDAHERRSLAALKRAEILISTDKPELFIINPFKLRRGKPLSTIMASLHHYHKDNSIFKLTDLQPPKRTILGLIPS